MNVTRDYHLQTTVGDEDTSQMLSDETTETISRILLYGVTPFIGIIGVTGNTFSIIILRKHGLHKCSNILLISLAFMDMSFLTAYNSIPHIIYYMQGGDRFLYSRSVSQVWYVLYFVYIVTDYTSCCAALCMPMLITIERLVAVYLPLKFGQIVTPSRTWAVVISVELFWLACMAYLCFWYKFEYVFDETLNRSVGKISRSDIYFRDRHAVPIVEEMFFNMKIPPAITVIGCTAIIIKVKISSRKRSKMTASAKQTSTSRTTNTLLAVSFAYLFTVTIFAIPVYLPADMSAYKFTTENPTNVGMVVYQLINIMLMINSSWNFLVYVVMNKNFRDTFKEIMNCSQRNSNKY